MVSLLLVSYKIKVAALYMIIMNGQGMPVLFVRNNEEFTTMSQCKKSKKYYETHPTAEMDGSVMWVSNYFDEDDQRTEKFVCSPIGISI